MAARTEIKAGRVATYNSADRKTFDSDEEMAYFSAEYSGSFSVPQRIGLYEATVPHLITDALPSGVAAVWGMARYLSTYFTTDWCAIGGTFCGEFAFKGPPIDPRYFTFFSLRLDGTSLYIDEYAYVGASSGGVNVVNLGGTFQYQLVVGGFN